MSNELDSYNASKEQARLFQKQTKAMIMADDWIDSLPDNKLDSLLLECAIQNSTIYQTFNGVDVRMNQKLANEKQKRVQREIEEARKQDPNWGAFT